LSASATPVRDALHRLSGERLVESWHQEGFHPPVHNETDLRDLYAWSQVLLGLALRLPGNAPSPLDTPVCGVGGDDYPARIGRLFRAIALQSTNRELRAAIANLVDRCHGLRRAEAATDPPCHDALAGMEGDFAAARWRNLRAGLAGFHRRRIATARQVALYLRPAGRELG
jgi:DNA-binding GntR family transcriptional regulator